MKLSILQQNAYGTEEAKGDLDRQGVGGVGGPCTPLLFLPYGYFWIQGPVASCPKRKYLGALVKKIHFIWVWIYFSTKVLIGDTIFTSPTGDGIAILRGHPSHAKGYPFAGQRQYLHFFVILRPWVLVRSRESNARPPALQSSALPTEIILPRLQ